MTGYQIIGGALGAKALTIRQFDEFLDYVAAGGDGKTAQDLYKCVAWAFWCANLRANNIAKIPYAVYPLELPEDDEDADRQVEWPFDMRPVLWLDEMWLSLKGASYDLKQMQGDMLTGLRSLNANSMHVEEWDADGPTLFRQQVGGKTVFYPADQIVYMRSFDPGGDIHEGVSSGQVGSEAGSLIKHANLWASGFFENGAIPSIILEAQGQVSKADRDEIRSVWKRALGGIRNVWEVMVLRKGLEAKVITPPVSDLAMPDLERTKRDQILAAHMIPPGLGETKTNRAERDALQYELWDQALIPHIETHIGPTLDKQLFNPLGLRIRFETWKIEAIQKEEIAKAESSAFYISGVMSKAYEDNVTSVDEYRRVLNQILDMGNMPLLDETFTPEERTPLQLTPGEEGEDDGGNEVSDNIENRVSPKALPPQWGHLTVSLQNSAGGETKQQSGGDLVSFTVT